MNERLTIAFLPEAAYGASLNCVALAQELRELGLRPVFLCDPGFAGMFGNYGFDEVPVAMSPQRSDAEIADFWQRFIDQHRPHFHLSPLEQIATYEVPAWNAIVRLVKFTLMIAWPMVGAIIGTTMNSRYVPKSLPPSPLNTTRCPMPGTPAPIMPPIGGPGGGP